MTLAEIKKCHYLPDGIRHENIRPKLVDTGSWGFVTSEQPPNGLRRYSIRFCDEPSRSVAFSVIRNLSRDQAIATLQKKANEFKSKQ